MSDDTDRLAPENSDLRGHIESATASHTLGPDIDSAVSGALEQHSRNIRDQNDREAKGRLAPHEMTRQDRLRHSIREAVQHAKEKAAAPQRPKTNGFELPAGPPISWPKEAKARWDELPHEARMAALREQKAYADSVTPIVERFSEIEKVIAPHRELYSTRGISDAAAVGELFNWWHHLRGPQRAQAFAHLMQETGTPLDAIYNVMNGGQPVYPAQQGYQLPPEVEQMQQNIAVEQMLTTFAKDKPHFQAVRVFMGETLRDHYERYTVNGQVDLDRLYRDCCHAAGLGDGHTRARRNAGSVSTRGRAPSGSSRDNERAAPGVRNSIKAAIAEARERT